MSFNRIFAAKAALNIEQINDRYNRGSRNLEIHTIPKYFSGDFNYDSFFKYIEEKRMNVVSIHSPMITLDNKNVGVGNKDCRQGLKLVEQSIELAEKYIMQYPKIVVVHIADIKEENKNKENILKTVKEDIIHLSRYAEKYNDVIVCIENHMKLINYKGNIKDCQAIGYEDDVVNLIKTLKLPNIGTTLDICHALATIKYNSKTSSGKYKKLEDFFANQQSVLKHIHLATCEEFGILSDHGLGFNDNNKEELVEFVKLLKKYDYNNSIVIETIDKNINAYEAYSKTIELLKANSEILAINVIQ
ncbi:MAG: TIM barrel protein [Clostridia bacterium]